MSGKKVDILYWLWIFTALNRNCLKLPEIIRYFGDPEAFFKASEAEMRLSGLFTGAEIRRIKSTSPENEQQHLNAARSLGFKIVAYDDGLYPELLRKIDSPPAALYIQGTMPRFDEEVAIAMVGTRRATPYGYEASLMLSNRLASAGVIVVSGCAKGIDTASHRGALDGGGITAGVLGCGIDYPYNIENKHLRERICENGALISEYPPGTPPLQYHFPRRNRIISGLCRGTVVIEAGAKSGSLITANLAAQQGRDIFAIPGNLRSNYSLGTNRLIKDGAYPVDCPFDILEKYASEFPHKLDLVGSKKAIFADYPLLPGIVSDTLRSTPSAPVHHSKKQPYSTSGDSDPDKCSEYHGDVRENINSENSAAVSDTAKTVLDCLGGDICHTDELAERTGISVPSLLRALTELELVGLVRSLPGRKYTASKK